MKGKRIVQIVSLVLIAAVIITLFFVKRANTQAKLEEPVVTLVQAEAQPEPVRADLSYPATISEGDIDAFFEKEGGALPENTGYEVAEAGKLVLTFPEGVTADEAQSIAVSLASSLEAFVSQQLSEEEKESGTETGSITLYGYTLVYEAVPGKAELSYPDFITESDIDSFFAYAFPRHQEALEGVHYEVSAPGGMTVTFPETVTVDDASALVDMLISDLQTWIGVDGQAVSSIPETTGQREGTEVKVEVSQLETPEEAEPLFVTEIDEEALRSSGMPVMVQLFSTSCIPCMSMMDDLRAFYSENYGKVKVVALNVDEYPEEAMNYPVSVVPTQLFFTASGEKYIPSQRITGSVGNFVRYTYTDTGELAYVVHQGILTKSQMERITSEAGGM